jgi:uncharacterized membrane protein
MAGGRGAAWMAYRMAELSGVLRALSFLGLGGALVGIGYAYRRLRPLQPS